MIFKKLKELIKEKETRREIAILMSISFGFGGIYGLLVSYGIAFWAISILISLIIGFRIGKHRHSE